MKTLKNIGMELYFLNIIMCLSVLISISISATLWHCSRNFINQDN